MGLPTNLIELAFGSEEIAGDVDVTEVVKRAATIVEEFADNATCQSLDAVLAAAKHPDASVAARKAQSAARKMVHQSLVLHDELARFQAATVKK